MTDTTIHVPPAANGKLWTIVAAGLVASIGVSAFFPTMFAGLPFLVGILSYIALSVFLKTVLLPDKFLLFWWGAFVVFVAIAMSWAVYPEDSFERSVKICLIFALALPFLAVFRNMPDEQRAFFQGAFPVILIFQGLFTLVEFHFDYPIRRFFCDEQEILPQYLLNKNMAVFAVLLAPTLFFIIRSGTYWLLVPVLLLTGFMLFDSTSQSAQLSVAVMLVAALVYRLIGRYAVLLAGAVLFFGLVSAPFVAPPAFDMFADMAADQGSLIQRGSGALRLENYDFISRKIMEKPWTGFGLDSTRNITFDAEQIYYKSNTITHPHNAFLQIWIEFGVLGVLFFGGFLVMTLKKLYVMEGRNQAMCFVMFCLMAVFFMLTWSMWASWLLGLTFTVYGISMAFGDRKEISDAQTS